VYNERGGKTLHNIFNLGISSCGQLLSAAVFKELPVPSVYEAWWAHNLSGETLPSCRTFPIKPVASHFTDCTVTTQNFNHISLWLPLSQITD